MTQRDHASRLSGYYPSRWPAECAGPRRQKLVASPGLDLQPGETLKATHRVLGNQQWPVMLVQRAPGELYLQGGTRTGQREVSFGWVYKIDPVTLETILESPRLPSGGHNWCGAATVHENGDIYVVNGCYCHRLSPDLDVLAERRLPVENAHNGHLILSDGNLCTKDIQNDPSKRSQFTVLDPELEVVDRFELPENSVGRFSSDRSPECDFLYVTSPTKIYRLLYRDRKLSLDPTWVGSYDIPGEDQSFAWDSCVGSDSVWFQDMGEGGGVRDVLASHPIGTNRSRGPNLRRLAQVLRPFALLRPVGLDRLLLRRGLLRRPLHSAPQRVFRFSVHDAADRDVLVPFGIPGGGIFAPPLYDQDRRILVAFDSMNAKVGAWRYQEKGKFEELWVHDFRNTSQLTLYADTGELLVDDVQPLRQWDAVVLDVETGAEKGRANTGCVMSGGMWYTPGFGRDFYTSTGSGGFARIYVAEPGVS